MKRQISVVILSAIAFCPIARAEIGQSEVSVEMGRTDQGRGLNRVRAASDELVQPFSVVKSEQFGTPRDVDGKKVMDFYTDPQVIRNRAKDVTITIDYLDKGTGDITVQYAQTDSKDLKTAGAKITLANSSQLKHKTIQLSDALVVNSAGPSLRLVSSENFLVKRVTLGAPEAKPSEKRVQTACLPEKDENSPRKSKLTGDKSQIIRTDLDGDGDPDVLECWWNGKRARWIDENDDMKPSDVRGDMVGDSVQIDRDGDGYYDGPDDMNIKWVDDDNDGDPDAEIVTMNPSPTQPRISSGSSHYMVYIDNDDDNVNAYINWDNFDFANWRTTGAGNFSPDYNGNATFLKQHIPPWIVTDPRYNWENPFCFYDFDNDGCTEMSIRLLDTTRDEESKIESGDPLRTYNKQINEGYVSYDLDNDSQKGNEMDYDMTLRFASKEGKGEKIDYSDFHNKHPNMKAPQWALPLFRYPNWRKIDEFIYVPLEKAYDELFKPKWAECWLVFDEDDDDHRWERVEMYYPTTNVYSTARWDKDKKGGGLDAHVQSDTLGDRGEWDLDNSGGGKLYIGRWDKKIHLLGAETGAWSVDYGAKYWGSSPVNGDSSPLKAPTVEEIVQYKDTDNNGFFDQVTFDYDGDQKVDLTINLLELKTDKNPHPDVAEIISPAELKWQGMHELYIKISNDSFQDALTMYRAAWKKGYTNKELEDLAIASSTAEKYDHGYWLKEKLFRMIDLDLAKSKEQRNRFRTAYWLGDMKGVVEVIGELEGRN
jgi:hypothetical protein